MSTQRGNVKKKGAQKYQNRTAFKNVYHDTSKRTQTIISTEVTGVCQRCKDAIDWKIKYKKYKPLTQAKTCAMCKQKAIKQAYHTYCLPCSAEADKCAKCGEKKDIVVESKPSAAEQAREERQLQFDLEMLPERKRRTYLRLKEKGELTEDILAKMMEGVGDDGFSFGDDIDGDLDDDSDEDDSDVVQSSTGNGSSDLTGKTHKLNIGGGDS